MADALLFYEFSPREGSRLMPEAASRRCTASYEAVARYARRFLVRFALSAEAISGWLRFIGMSLRYGWPVALRGLVKLPPGFS